MVLLHGIGSNASSFERLAKHLPEDWTLLAWNAPGYGQSESLSNSEPLPRHYADRLHEFLVALDTGSSVLVGHSLGTLIAVDFAARYPGGVDGLVLIACAQGYGMRAGDPLPASARTRLQDLDRLGPGEFAESRAPRLLAAPDSDVELRKDAIAAMASINRGGYAQAVHMLASGNLSAAAAAVKSPSLVLVGKQDRITPAEQSRNVHIALQRSGSAFDHCYREIENAGHLVHQEKPEMVAAVIAQFVMANVRQPAGECQ